MPPNSSPAPPRRPRAKAADTVQFTEKQQRILAVLESEDNRGKTVEAICMLADVSTTTWAYGVRTNPHFVEALHALNVTVFRGGSPYGRSTDVSLATDLESELASDTWDMRRLRPDYPKHAPPSVFIVRFAWIENPSVRQQVKLYFRHCLPKWRPKTFSNVIYELKPFLSRLPPNVDLAHLTRDHVDAVLPTILQLSERQAHRCLVSVRCMLDYMATSRAWSGERPERFLIWRDDVPSSSHALPRPIPPDVVDQIDTLLERAMHAIAGGQEPPILSATMWDVILILRRTGMRFADLAHLKAPDEHDHQGCLERDSSGYWWIRIHHKLTKTNRDHRIPTRIDDGVIAAVRRQRERAAAFPNHYGENYLFRTEDGVLSYITFKRQLAKLSQFLLHEKRSYRIAGHQFRHTIATDMIEQGIDIYTVKEFLGHTSLTMTERYVKVYLSSLKAKYDTYRAKREAERLALVGPDGGHVASDVTVEVSSPSGEEDGGWVEGRVGTLYRSPLPGGEGFCEHLAMLDPCPDIPVCDTCPRFRATRRHLPAWERRVGHLQLTVLALNANPAFYRAKQKHEAELRQAQKIRETIQEEGFWDGRVHND